MDKLAESDFINIMRQDVVLVLISYEYHKYNCFANQNMAKLLIYFILLKFILKAEKNKKGIVFLSLMKGIHTIKTFPWKRTMGEGHQPLCGKGHVKETNVDAPN